MDAEIQAMGVISEALAPLDQDAVRRVLKWALERYQPRQGMPSTSVHVDTSPLVGVPTATPSRTFLGVHELFDAANPESGLDRVLVAAYWFQVLQGQPDWDSQKVNTELKHLGHPSSNITRDLDALMMKTPKQVIQVRKQGNTQQARKLYCLTREGTRAVEAMLSRSAPFAEG
jgi:hypothetical protein